MEKDIGVLPGKALPLRRLRLRLSLRLHAPRAPQRYLLPGLSKKILRRRMPPRGGLGSGARISSPCFAAGALCFLWIGRRERWPLDL